MPIKSIIEELDTFKNESDKDLLIESRANHAIVAAMNVIKLINENYNEKEASELTRRLINSIKGNDPRKFHRKIRQIKESRDES